MLPYVNTIFLVIGTASMVLGAYLALGQNDYKRLLAYSSISQIGFVVFALGLATPLAYLGALFHMINHAVFKSLLFLDAGSVVYRTDERDMNKLGGISEVMPITGSTALIGSLSIGGIPPLSGFWSKLVIILAAVQSGHYILASVAVLASIVTITYYLKSLRFTFFGELPAAFAKIKESPVLMCIPLIILTILTIGMGVLLLPGVRALLLDPAVSIIEGGIDYAKTVLGG